MIPLLKAIPRSLGLLGDHELAIGYNVWFYALNKLRGSFYFLKGHILTKVIFMKTNIKTRHKKSCMTKCNEETCIYSIFIRFFKLGYIHYMGGIHSDNFN
jgi:hypothetical protein